MRLSHDGGFELLPPVRGQPPAKPIGRIQAWQDVIDAGRAAAVCDEVVQTRPVPPRLLHALGLLRRP